jgi:hypothetical protein
MIVNRSRDSPTAWDGFIDRPGLERWRNAVAVGPLIFGGERTASALGRELNGGFEVYNGSEQTFVYVVAGGECYSDRVFIDDFESIARGDRQCLHSRKGLSRVNRWAVLRHCGFGSASYGCPQNSRVLAACLGCGHMAPLSVRELVRRQ